MKKPFEGIFGNTVELRLLEFLLPLDGIEFNISELTEEAGISRQSVDKVVKKFVHWGVMKESSTRSGITKYEINPESPYIKLFHEINNKIIENILGVEDARLLLELIGLGERPERCHLPESGSDIPKIGWGRQPDIYPWNISRNFGCQAEVASCESKATSMQTKPFQNYVTNIGGHSNAAS